MTVFGAKGFQKVTPMLHRTTLLRDGEVDLVQVQRDVLQLLWNTGSVFWARYARNPDFRWGEQTAGTEIPDFYSSQILVLACPNQGPLPAISTIPGKEENQGISIT